MRLLQGLCRKFDQMVASIGRWLRKSGNTIYGWARDGQIPCVRVGRSYIFDKAALLKWARPEEA